MQDSLASALEQYFPEDIRVDWQTGDIPVCPIPMSTKGMQANSYFFGHPKLGREYFETSHRSEFLRHGCKQRSEIGTTK